MAVEVSTRKTERISKLSVRKTPNKIKYQMEIGLK